MQSVKKLRNMPLHASKNQTLSSVYGYAIATVNPESTEVSFRFSTPRAKRRARRWAVQSRTDKVLSAL